MDELSRAQSDVVGVALLAGVVVVASVAVGAAVLDGTTAGVQEGATDVRVAVTPESLVLVHNGGDSRRCAGLTLVVRANGSRKPVEWADGTLTGDSPERFQPGERWSNDSLTFDRNATVEILLVEEPSGQTLLRTTRQPETSPLAPATDTPTPAQATPLPNRAPEAALSASTTDVETGDDVQFTSASTDADGTIVTRAWDVDGDGTTEATGESVSTSYDDDGTYAVSLTVTDDDGRDDTATTTVSVANRPPVAAADADATTAYVGEPIQFTNASFDNDGSVDAVTWQFGDGETSAVSDPTHAYDSAGTYDISLTVTDDDGASSTDVVQVVVEENDPPTAVLGFDRWYLVWFTWGNYTWTERQTNLTAADSTDPDGPEGRLEYEWDIETVDRLWEYEAGGTLSDDDMQLSDPLAAKTALRLLENPEGWSAYQVTVELTVTDTGGETATTHQTFYVYV